MEALTPAIGWASLVLGSFALVVGIAIAWIRRNDQPPASTEEAIGEQGIGDVIAQMTAFATALKDLDLSGRLMTVGVLLIAVSAMVAGFDNLAEAIEMTAAN